MTEQEDTTKTTGFVCPEQRPLYPDLSLFHQNLIVIGVMCYVAASTFGFLRLYDRIEKRGWFRGWWPTLVKTWPLLGVLVYLPVGIHLHFVDPHPQTCIVPPNSTWGWWWMPGSIDFCVAWTGVAEIMGGLGLAVGGFYKKNDLTSLRRGSSKFLVFLTVGMTFAHCYMITHGALQFELDEPIPLTVQMIRLTVQGLWLSNLMYMATHDGPLGEKSSTKKAE